MVAVAVVVGMKVRCAIICAAAPHAEFKLPKNHDPLRCTQTQLDSKQPGIATSTALNHLVSPSCVPRRETLLPHTVSGNVGFITQRAAYYLQMQAFMTHFHSMRRKRYGPIYQDATLVRQGNNEKAQGAVHEAITPQTVPHLIFEASYHTADWAATRQRRWRSQAAVLQS